MLHKAVYQLHIQSFLKLQLSYKLSYQGEKLMN